MSEPEQLIAAAERAFREGYQAGYRQGEDDLSRYECGGGGTHPHTKKRCEDEAWRDSEAKANV